MFRGDPKVTTPFQELLKEKRSTESAVKALLRFHPVPMKLKGGKKTQITSVGAGGYSSFAIDQNGEVYSWGLNNYGQLGHRTGDATIQYKPKHASKMAGVAKVSAIAAGDHFAIVLSDDNKVFGIGRGDCGQLGVPFAAGAPQETEDLTLVSSLAGEKVTAVACGGACSFAIAEGGKAFAWGFGENQQLGDPSDGEDLLAPNLIEGKQLLERTIVQIDAGGQHSCAVATDN